MPRVRGCSKGAQGAVLYQFDDMPAGGGAAALRFEAAPLRPAIARGFGRKAEGARVRDLDLVADLGVRIGSREWFRRLHGLAEEHGLRELSMGTTQDYAVAAEEGATYVRVGAVLFR